MNLLTCVMRTSICFALVLLFVSCQKAPTEPSADLTGFVGTFTGDYEEILCMIPPVTETEIKAVRAEVSIADKNWLGVSLFRPEGSLLLAFEARYENDSTLFIAPFPLGASLFTGNVRYSDKFTITMANRSAPCVIMGDTIATLTFRAPR